MTERPADCVLWSWWLMALTAALPLTALLAVATAYFAVAWRLWIWGGWVATLMLFLTLYLPLRRRGMRFRFTDDGIAVTSGVLFVTTRRIRREAVRQTTILQGPVERRYGTAFLLVSATGGHLMAEGIPLAQAEDWCRRLQHP